MGQLYVTEPSSRRLQIQWLNHNIRAEKSMENHSRWWFSKCAPQINCISTVGVCMLCRVWVFETLWTVARQAPLSIGFSRQEYWSELLCPPPGDFPNPGMGPAAHYVSCFGRQILNPSCPWEDPYMYTYIAIYINSFLKKYSRVPWILYEKPPFGFLYPSKQDVWVTVYMECNIQALRECTSELSFAFKASL